MNLHAVLRRGKLAAVRWWEQFHDVLVQWRAIDRSRADIDARLSPEGRRLGWYVVLLGILIAVLPTAQAFVLGHVWDALKPVGIGQPALEIWLTMTGLFALLVLTVPALRTIQNEVFNDAQRHVVTMARLAISRKVSAVDKGTFDSREVQQLVTKVSENSIRIFEFWKSRVLLIQALTGATSALLVLVFYRWWLAVPVALASLPLVFISTRYARADWRLRERHQPGWKRFWWLLWYCRERSASRDLRTNGLQEQIIGMAMAQCERLYREERKLSSAYLWPKLKAAFLAYGTAALACALLIWIGVHGYLPVGQLTFLVASVLAFASTLAEAGTSFGLVQQHSLIVNDWQTLLRIEPKIVSPPNGRHIGRDEPIEICFRDVWFAYPSKSKAWAGQREPQWVLKGLNLTVRSGEQIALVGKNGRGKSTLMALILRDYDPDRGQVLVNGTDLREIDLASWLRRIGVVFQKQELYHIRLGLQTAMRRPGHVYDPEKDLDALEDAAMRASATEVLDKMEGRWRSEANIAPRKPDDPVIDPSGGETQRLLLAGALFRDADLLLLDEPTAQIDPVASREIVSGLFGGKKMLILASHNFSNVCKAPRIVVIGDGAVIEDGSHDALLKVENGVYREMYLSEAEAFRAREEAERRLNELG